MVKIFFLLNIILVSIWLIIIRGTLPRYRIDQLQLNIWKDWIFVWLMFFLANFLTWIYYII